MDVLLRLYNMVNPAADGSIISREVTEEYLQSEDYKTIIREKIALGGKTHKDRNVDDEYRASVGPDDQVLIDMNSLFYIKKIFTKPDSDFCWAIIHIYDPANFSGKLHDEIVNLRGMLKEGTKLPCSVVIQAVWAPDNRCLKIIRIKGVDFTLNPSFAGSGTEKLMSVHILSNENETKMFSDVKGVKTGVRAFGLTTEVSFDGTQNEETVDNHDDVWTKRDIILTFGRNSDEYKAFALTQKLTDRSILKKDELTKAVEALHKGTDSVSQDEFLKDLGDVVTPENKELFLQLYHRGPGQIQQLVSAVPKDDPNYNELIKTRLINFLKTMPTSDKIFSLGTVIVDKFKVTQYPRVLRFLFVIRLYKQFWLANEKNMDEEKRRQLEEIFIADVMYLIKDALEYIKLGFNLSSYYQMGGLNPDLSRAARILSYYYRRLLVSEDVLGFIPAGIYKGWNQSLVDFLQVLITYTFGARLSNVNLSFIK